MSWTKKITVYYYQIETAEEDYFVKFHENAQTMLATGNSAGTFEAGNLNYSWKILGTLDLHESATYLFTIARERTGWPVWLTEEGDSAELSLPGGILGEVSYGIVNPAHKTLLCFAAGPGGSTSGFKKLLGQFSPEGVVRLTPYFEENIDERVMNWDYFRKFSLSVNMPSGDDVSEFAATKAGSLVKLLDHLGGLKANISVTSGSGKELLSSMMVKDLLPELLSNELINSLTVQGSDFESAASEQFDLKNAQIKYSEQIVIEGNYLTESDTRQIFTRAVNERYSIIFK